MNSPRRIKIPQPISYDNFKKFGTLLHDDSLQSVEPGKEFNFTLTAQEIALAPLCCTGILTCVSRAPQVTQMERHVDSSEILVALDGDFHLVVAPADDNLHTNEHMRTFILKQGQAIAMKP